MIVARPCPSLPYVPIHVPSVDVSAFTNVAVFPLAATVALSVTVAVAVAAVASAVVAVTVTVDDVVIVAGAVYKPVDEMEPDVDGLIVHVTVSPVAVGFVIVAANCCVPFALKLAVVGVTPTDSVPVPPPPPPVVVPPTGSKNIPLTAEFGPPVNVTLIFTLPETLNTRYSPPLKPEIVWLASCVPLVPSTI